MKVTTNFDLREFVSESTWNKWGAKSTWFLDPRVPVAAQSYKDYFFKHYKSIHGDKLESVVVNVNTWLWGGDKIGRGYREPEQYNTGQFKSNPNSESQHRQGKAFDCVIELRFKDGRREFIKTSELIDIIKSDWPYFKSLGITTLEGAKMAPTWLHTDFRNTRSEELFIFGE